MIDSDDKISKEIDNISSCDNNIISNNIDTVPSSDVPLDILKSMYEKTIVVVKKIIPLVISP